MKMSERASDQYENVRVDRQGAVCLVTIDRAIRQNALDPATLDELRHAFALLGDDTEVRVIVLTGAGGEHFSIGAEVADLAEMTSETARSYLERGQSFVELIEKFDKPIIAAINGAAFGGGCDLAFACALRVAVPEATFAYIDASLGISAAFGATHRLPRLIGRAWALELLLTGRKLSAAEALDWGLVNRIVPASELLAASLELAERIAVGAPLAIKSVLASVAQGTEVPLAKALQYESALFGLCFATEDAREGARAFLEKRVPKFHGR
jgi:enoyl-CoA hydratase